MTYVVHSRLVKTATSHAHAHATIRAAISKFLAVSLLEQLLEQLIASFIAWLPVIGDIWHLKIQENTGQSDSLLSRRQPMRVSLFHAHGSVALRSDQRSESKWDRASYRDHVQL